MTVSESRRIEKVKDQIEVGHVELTSRGFRQDTDQAMKADILRGLIEAITNSDDSYGDREGSILIRISKGEGREWTVSVSDRANGIPHKQLKEKLLRLGARTSGHEGGQPVRGNRGRGAKDLSSFGSARWDTIRDEEYSWLELDRNGDFKSPSKPSRPTTQIRDHLGIKRGNGTRVTVHCRGTIPKPKSASIKKRLERCVQLRHVMQNPKRRVILEYGDEKPQPLHYSPPAGLIEVERCEITIPGYQKKASVVIQEAPNQFEESPSDLCREGGILIVSGRAAHESTLFGFEADDYARFFCGEVRWEEIDDIARDFDYLEDHGSSTRENPFSIISRSRDGLEKSHPAYKTLKSSVERVLAKHIARKRKEAGQTGRETAETQRRLHELAQIIAKFRSDKEEEYELDPSIGPGGKGVAEFRIIPPAKFLEQGRTHTFTVELRRNRFDEAPAGTTVRLSALKEPDDVIQLSTQEVTLKPVLNKPEIVRGTFAITASNREGTAIVEASFPSVQACVTTVEVVPPIKLEPPDPPLTFEFERTHYSVLPSKSKSVLLLAPAAAVNKHGSKVRLLSSDPKGVLIRHGVIDLKPSPDGPWFQADVTFEGRQLGAKATITAECGAGPLKATTEVSVRREPGGPSIEICLKEIPGYQRATWEKAADGAITITINAAHPAARRYLGPGPDFPGQNLIASRVVIAEIVAEEAVRDILARKYGSQPVDVTSYYAERYRMLNDLLPKCHAIEISEAELLSPSEIASQTNKVTQQPPKSRRSKATHSNSMPLLASAKS